MRSLVGVLVGLACAVVTFVLAVGFFSVVLEDFGNEHEVLSILIPAVLAVVAGLTARRGWRGR